MRVGIIGGGLMGREAASGFGRWFALQDFPVRAKLTAVCDLPRGLARVVRPSAHCAVPHQEPRQLLASDQVDVVYVAVPHNLHEKLYCDVLAALKSHAEKAVVEL